MSQESQIRRATPADAQACAQIIYRAFAGISAAHNFPCDFPNVEFALPVANMLTSHPAFYGVVAEAGGKIVGCNFLDERDAIAGVGPMTIDPDHQSHGLGRLLMRAVIDRGQKAPGIRLVQDAFNTTSLALYASLGFEVKEHLAILRGTLRGRLQGDGQVRPMTEADLPAAGELCRRIHGFDRISEMCDAVKHVNPLVLIRDGQLQAYVTSPNFWIVNHGVATTEAHMRDLLLAASAASNKPVELLLPTRQANLFRWCLSEGLRIVKPMTLMAMGQYHEPKGCYFPSVSY